MPLAERRVRVDREADVLEERVHLEGERALADEVARFGADDVHAEQLVGLLVGDDLEEAVGLVARPSRGRAPRTGTCRRGPRCPSPSPAPR